MIVVFFLVNNTKLMKQLNVERDSLSTLIIHQHSSFNTQKHSTSSLISAILGGWVGGGGNLLVPKGIHVELVVHIEDAN